MLSARTVRVGIAALLFASACTGGGSGGSGSPAPPPDVTPIDTRPVAPTVDEVAPPPPRPSPGKPAAGGDDDDEPEAAAPFKGTTDPTEKKRPGIKPVVLREVRAARNEGYDRVVLEFAGDGVSGYRVEYLKGQATQCGSGNPVPIAGQALLSVRLQPAQAHDDAGKATIKDRERKPELPVITEMEQICDFEGQVEWVLGLTAKKPYRVLELASPPRIVVDVQH